LSPAILFIFFGDRPDFPVFTSTVSTKCATCFLSSPFAGVETADKRREKGKRTRIAEAHQKLIHAPYSPSPGRNPAGIPMLRTRVTAAEETSEFLDPRSSRCYSTQAVYLIRVEQIDSDDGRSKTARKVAIRSAARADQNKQERPSTKQYDIDRCCSLHCPFCV
jgi:uncharacterized protein with ATP-grasp and redox domains